MRDLARVVAEDEAAYVPYELDGKPAGEVQLIRQRDTENRPLFVGFYRCAYEFEGTQVYDTNDSMFILEGEAHVRTSDGAELHLKPGDMATFRKGQTCTFRQTAGFKKFFVMSD